MAKYREYRMLDFEALKEMCEKSGWTNEALGLDACIEPLQNQLYEIILEKQEEAGSMKYNLEHADFERMAKAVCNTIECDDIPWAMSFIASRCFILFEEV